MRSPDVVYLLLLAASMLLLSGCTTTSTTTSGGTTKEVAPSADKPDLIRSGRVRFELATAYFANGQTDTALSEVKAAIVADPNLAGAYALLALIQASKGDQRAADESFQRALKLDPRDAGTQHNYGWFLCQQRRWREADVQFAGVLAQPGYRDAPRTLLVQGICLARAGSLEPAERALSRAYELDPANPTTAVNLAEVLYRKTEYERARFYIRRVNSQPDLASAQTLWLAARIENKIGNPAGARDFGSQLRSRFPLAPQTLLFEKGRFDD
jgi:type IV pilus assembly protein PilF